PRARDEQDHADPAEGVVAAGLVERLFRGAKMVLVDVDAEAVGADVVQHLVAAAAGVGLPAPACLDRRAAPVAEAATPAFAAVAGVEAFEPVQALRLELACAAFGQGIGQEP